MPVTMCLADFDLPTRSASGFLIRWIAPRVEPAHLYSLLDRKETFILSLSPSDIIIGVGHGSVSAFTGQNEVLLLDKSSLPNIQGKVIYLVSCQTAKELGPALISSGARSFIGFREDVLWICDADMVSMPWSDKLAEPVIMPIVDGLNAILDGRTAQEAFKTQHDSFMKRLAVEEDELSASLIQWNMDSATLLGNPNGKIKARPALPLPFKLVPPPPMIFPLFRKGST